MVLPALLNVFPRLWKKPPTSAEDCVVLAAMSARQKKVFSFVIAVFYCRCVDCDLQQYCRKLYVSLTGVATACGKCLTVAETD